MIKFFTKPMVATALAVALAFGTFAASMTPAEAGRRGTFAAGVLAGVVGTAIVARERRKARERRRYRRVYRASHAERCARRYRSYDYRTDTFVGYDGIVRRCRL